MGQNRIDGIAGIRSKPNITPVTIAIMVHMLLFGTVTAWLVNFVFHNDISNPTLFIIAVVAISAFVLGLTLRFCIVKFLSKKFNGNLELYQVLKRFVDGDFSALFVKSETYGGEFEWGNEILTSLQNNLMKVCEAAVILADNASNGKFDMNVEAGELQGDWADLVNRLNQSTIAINEPLNEITSVMGKFREGDFRYRVETKHNGAFKEMADTLNATLDEVSSYVHEIEKILEGMAAGNLLHKIEREYVGSFDLIKRSVNSILARLNTTIEDIEMVAAGVAGGTSQLSKSSSDLAAEATEQMSSLQELSAVISEVDNQSKDNAANAQKAAEWSKISKNDAEAGNIEMQRLLEAMGDITNSVDKIFEINKTVGGVAHQINLLAINASIEAALAGSHGKGFGVVANEVRTLANRTSKAAKQASELMQEITDSISHGRTRANDTADSLNKIVSNVVEVSGVVGDIYEASLQQTQAISDINVGLMQINRVVQGKAIISEDAAQAAKELDAQVYILNEKLAFFQTRLAMPKISTIWKEATETVPESQILVNIPGTQKSYNAGEIIIYEGDVDAKSMFFVLNGIVAVYKAFGKANEMLLSTLKPGDLFGEISLFLDEPRTASVVAQENTMVVEIKEHDMYELMKGNPDVAYSVVATLCARLRNMLLVLEAY